MQNDRGLNGNHDDLGGGHGDISRSNQSNPPLRGRVGPAEEAAPAYSSIIGASTNEASEATLKNRAGKKGAKKSLRSCTPNQEQSATVRALARTTVKSDWINALCNESRLVWCKPRPENRAQVCANLHH